MADQNLPVRIFYMNDMEWWIGSASPEEMRDAFIEEYGEDAWSGFDNDIPRPLSDSELDSTPFCYDEDDLSKSRTFREQLAIEVAEGVPEPRMFACTEW